MKPYSVRKAGMRMGKPHYSSECNLCRIPLAIGGKSKETAENLALSHLEKVHNRKA